MVTIQDANKFAELLWPQFITIADSVFLGCECHGETVTPEHVRGLAATEVGLQSNEWFINHVHIFELINHEAPLRRSPDG